MNIKRTIGNNLRKFRREHQIQQNHLAQLSGYNTSTLRKIERGRQNVRIQTIYDLSIALKVPLTAFFEENEQ